MASSVTLHDVAKLAGVSIGTASQALNNRSSVLAETKARVFDAAKTLGYPLKNPVGSPLASPVSVIGLLTKHDFGVAFEVNPFYLHIQAGVESECRRRGVSMMVSNLDVDPSNHPVSWPPMLRHRNVEGLIVAGAFIEETIDRIGSQIECPVVLVDSYAPSLPFDTIVTNNQQGMQDAVDYLVEQGHIHIGLVGSNRHSPPSILERRSAYLSALEKRGIGSHYVEDSLLERWSVREAVLRLLLRCPQISAILACNDDCAVGVWDAAREMGLNIPNTLSVVGFDNIDLASQVQPGLTTVHVQKTWMGILGVRYLLDRILNPEQPKITTMVSTQLIIRESVSRIIEKSNPGE